MNPNSLSYPFPLVFARSRESKGCPNSHFELRGRGKGKIPLKTKIFASLLETKEYQNTLRPDHPESPINVSIFGLNNWFKITTVLFVLYTVLYIYICNHVLNWNI